MGYTNNIKQKDNLLKRAKSWMSHKEDYFGVEMGEDSFIHYSFDTIVVWALIMLNTNDCKLAPCCL